MWCKEKCKQREATTFQSKFVGLQHGFFFGLYTCMSKKRHKKDIDYTKSLFMLLKKHFLTLIPHVPALRGKCMKVKANHTI